VKTWIAWGALLTALVVVAFRPAPASVPAPERRIEVPVCVEVPVDVPRVVEKVRVETKIVEKQTPAAPPAGRVMTPADLAHEKMLFLFERALDLRGEQRRFMMEVLAGRELEIAEVQRDAVASGVFRFREYDERIRALQASSYERMKEVLDEPQRLRFTRLVAEGRLGDDVQFAVPQNVLILQD
jgi:hypothetical protein